MRSDSFDARLLQWIDDHRVDALTTVTTRLMHLSETKWLLWTIVFLGVGFVVYKRAWRQGLAIAIAFYTSAFIAALFKVSIERPRPTSPDALVQLSGYAMPSSHAAFTMAMVVALLVVVRWTSQQKLILVATGLGLAALVVGLSMIYLGAHWATDVLAGWALGAVIGATCGLVFRKRERST